jgi:hypothetical protein
MNPGCIPDNCTPNWVVTSVENRGTYGQAENTYHFNPYYVIYACSHHVVDWVTEEDTNHCNQNSGYWTKNECTDHVDAWKSAAPNPPGNNTQYSNSNVPQDCCNERDVDFNPDPTFTCNHYHACF